ncbi:MAG TPA: hypothetical protein VNP95_01140 [Thermomicrobiales bacterium]|nr:hypothetical protein [Thermomicrobiales bacterium]
MAAAEGVVLAAVDIGTNTLKFTVARCFPDGRVETIDERNDAVRIGAGIEQTGRIDPERLDRAVTTLKGFEAIGREHDARRFVGVATEALRVASNGRDLLDRIAKETAWEIRIIPGEEEARLTFLGLRDYLHDGGRATIVDIGGGSLEVIAATAGKVETAFSIPIGSGRVADRWFHADPPGADALRQAEDDARDFLRERAPILDGRGGTLLLSGGNGQFIEGLREHYRIAERLGIDTIARLLAILANEPADAVAAALAIQYERAVVLPAGVAIALAVAKAMEPVRVEAVPSGIRTGLLRDLIAREGMPGSP